MVKDVSKMDAKIGVPVHIEPPNEFILNILGMDYVRAVRLAWRAGNLTSVQIQQLGKLPPKPNAPLTPTERAEVVNRIPHRSIGTRRGRPRD